MRHSDLDTLLGEVHPFRRMSRSVVDMAVVTGLVVRVLHVVFSASSGELSWSAYAGRFILVPIIALAMAAVHLANFPVRQWLWRAPVFSLIEAASGAAASLALIALGRERWGTGRATLADWPSIATRMTVTHVIAICLFALILGAIVQYVRRREVTAEWREHGVHQHARMEAHPPGQPERRGVSSQTGNAGDAHTTPPTDRRTTDRND
jgi:hypothetical protein